MNLYGRLIALFIKNFFLQFKKSHSSDMFSECKTTFRVNLLDLDINLHMNNGRYLSIMDLGRIDLMIKAKVFWKLILNKYYPVVVSESICFKKSLEPFDSFQLKTKIESWDEKDFFIIQSFYRKSELIATGYIKGRFRKRGQKGSIKTKDLIEYLKLPPRTDQLSDLAISQIQIEKNLLEGNNH